jgi:cysteine-rich repeat protein
MRAGITGFVLAGALALSASPVRAQTAVCGNGVFEATEQCDDGNHHNLDGCDSTCHYEVVTRATSLALSGTSAPAALSCTPATNALGTRVFTSTGLSQLNPSFTTNISTGTTNLMMQFLGLTDLTGVSATGFSIGVSDAGVDPAKGAWPGNNPEDWWFLGDHFWFASGLPTNLLTNDILTARVLKAGPSNVSLVLFPGEPPVAMRSMRINATLDSSPAPNVPAPPPSVLAAGLSVFQTITANGAGQGLCGNMTVDSLAQIPIPASLAQGGGNTACASSCGGSHAYTYCGAGMPVGPSCNSLLDAIVGGCKVIPPICVAVINATQPDVPSGTTVTPLVLGPNNKVQQTAGDLDAYSAFMPFAANRAHFTGETCSVTADCQTGLFCTAGICAPPVVPAVSGSSWFVLAGALGGLGLYLSRFRSRKAI